MAALTASRSSTGDPDAELVVDISVGTFAADDCDDTEELETVVDDAVSGSAFKKYIKTQM